MTWVYSREVWRQKDTNTPHSGKWMDYLKIDQIESVAGTQTGTWLSHFTYLSQINSLIEVVFPGTIMHSARFRVRVTLSISTCVNRSSMLSSEMDFGLAVANDVDAIDRLRFQNPYYNTASDSLTGEVSGLWTVKTDVHWYFLHPEIRSPRLAVVQNTTIRR